MIEHLDTILELIMICSLTNSAPYYDCSNQWEIWIVEDDTLHCMTEAMACGWFNQRYIGNHIFKIPIGNLDYVNRDGETILWHELRHGLCECYLGHR